jgi:hypothetical protein
MYRHVAGKPHAVLEGTAMEVSGPIGYRAKKFMKAAGWHGKRPYCNLYANAINDRIKRLNRIQ